MREYTHTCFRYPSLHAVLLTFMLLVSLPLSAQKLTVESLEYVPNDAAAASYETQMQDINGNFAGVVKVHIALDDVQFEGGGVLKQEKRGMGEYWVWMAQGSNRLKVRAPGFLPLEVSFRMYEEVNIVKSKLTYKLVITVPVAGAVQQQDDGMSYLALTVEPANAQVVVDGAKKESENGEYMLLLARGNHTYEVSSTGYAPQSGSVLIGAEKKSLTIRLVSTKAQLKLECPTAGAKVYVNEQLKGTVPWTGNLNADTYRVEVRLDGHRSQSQTVSLTEKGNRTLQFTALTPITGSVNVAYSPMGSEVYIDGKKVGTSPDIFRSVGVGSHKVEIRKDGYVSASQTVTVKENATAELSGSLTAATNTTATSSSQSTSGSSGTRTFTAGGVTFNMVYVEGGTFTMGDGSGAHSVTLSSYYIGETEVTQELWQAVMGTLPSDISSSSYDLKGAQRPVCYVSWEDCQTFISKLNSMTGQRFHLPTEAQWEYAARGGSKSRGYEYSGSNDVGSVAWYYENSGDARLDDSSWNYDKLKSNNCRTHPVKTKSPNELGIYDMSGNVYELCQDWYSSYSSNAQTNPTGPSSGSYRVSRGGSWLNSAGYCRSSIRNFNTPSLRYDYLGLRLSL